MYYIDIDWNEVLVYQNKTLIHKESAMLLRDLKTEKILFVGNEAYFHLPDAKNLVVVVPVQNKKVLSYLDLNTLLEYVTKKLNIEIAIFVDRYAIDKSKINLAIDLIAEIEFIRVMTTKEYYLELRNNETQIINLINNNIETIKIGKYQILHYLHRFFYLNFKGILSTKKILVLFEQLKNKTFVPLQLQQINTGKTFVLENYDQNLLLKETRDFYYSITKNIDLSCFDLNQNMKDLKAICD